MKDFAYACPATIEDAVAAMQADGARALAGGTDLIPQMREGRRQVARVVDLKRIPELTSISTRADGGLVLGAAASASHVARHAAVASTYPAVAQSARLIGSLQVQNRASLGGNICNAAPSADAVPALICHRASVRIAGPNGAREELLEAFIRGPGKTSLAPGELRRVDRLAARRTKIGGDIPALHPAPRDGHRHRRRRRMGASRRGGQDRRGARCAGIGRADPDPGNIRRAASDRRTARPPPCSKPPAGSRQAMHAPSPTRAARPTTAARWSPC